MSQKTIILQYLREISDWVLAGKVRSIQTPYGFIGFRGDRDIRDMVREGILEKRMRGKFVEVRAIPIDQILDRYPTFHPEYMKKISPVGYIKSFPSVKLPPAFKEKVEENQNKLF